MKLAGLALLMVVLASAAFLDLTTRLARERRS
jgi:hypothetical protein